LAAPLVGEQLRNFGAISSPGRAREISGLFYDGCPEGFLLASPLRAVLEQVFSGLYAVLAPPALRVRAAGRPLEILSGEAVATLQLMGGEAFAGACHDGVRFMLSARSVLAATYFGEISADPVPGLSERECEISP